MIRNTEELRNLSSTEKAKLFDDMLDHLHSCPLGWHGDKLLTHKSVVEKDIVDWLKETQSVLTVKQDGENC